MALLNTKYLVGLGSNHMENTVLLRICQFTSKFSIGLKFQVLFQNYSSP